MNEIPDRHIFFEESGDSFDLRGLLLKFFGYWKIFAFSLLFFLGVAYVYNRFSQPLYPVKASLYIEEDKRLANNSLLQELNLFDLPTNLENEMEVLKSNSLVSQVVDSLQLNVRYYKETESGRIELFGSESPINCHLVNAGVGFESGTFEVRILDDLHFEISGPELNSKGQVEVFRFGNAVKFSEGSMIIDKKEIYRGKFHNESLSVELNNPVLYSEDLISRLVIKPVNVRASIIEISLQTATPQRGVDILNAVESQ